MMSPWYKSVSAKMSPLPFVGKNVLSVSGPVWRAYTNDPPFTGVPWQAVEVFTPDDEEELEPAGIENSETASELAAIPATTFSDR
jgi:hypothetical protein